MKRYLAKLEQETPRNETSNSIMIILDRHYNSATASNQLLSRQIRGKMDAVMKAHQMQLKKLTEEKVQISRENGTYGETIAKINAEKEQLADENAQLAARNAHLANENANLVAEKAQLADAKARLAAEESQIAAEKARLADESSELETRNDQLNKTALRAEIEKGKIESDFNEKLAEIQTENGRLLAKLAEMKAAQKKEAENHKKKLREIIDQLVDMKNT